MCCGLVAGLWAKFCGSSFLLTSSCNLRCTQLVIARTRVVNAAHGEIISTYNCVNRNKRLKTFTALLKRGRIDCLVYTTSCRRRSSIEFPVDSAPDKMLYMALFSFMFSPHGTQSIYRCGSFLYLCLCVMWWSMCLC